jgi:hypothetical protein
MRFEVEPVTVTIQRIYKIISVEVRRLQLHEYVELNITFIDPDDSHQENFIYKVEGEEYHAWGDDDSYIQQWVLNKFNLQLKPPVVPSTELSEPLQEEEEEKMIE